MNETVKEFIEAAIVEIDNENYEGAFDIWYNHFANIDNNVDYRNLEDLFRTFDSIGIDLYRASEDARKHLIFLYMYKELDDIFTNYPNKKDVSLPQAVKLLNSKLEVRLSEINEIFKGVGRALSKKHNVTITSFHINRAE